MTPSSFRKAPGVHIEPCFLEPADHANLLSQSLTNEHDYKDSEVTHYIDGHATASRLNWKTRRSRSRDLDKGTVTLFKRKVQGIAARIEKATGASFPERPKFELEAVHFGDGAFFANHIDTITGERNNHRVISAIYYYSRSPKGFTGGELKISSISNTEAITIEPEDNSMVFFSSIFPHEVLPVSVPSGAYEDGRFSINCWVLRAD